MSSVLKLRLRYAHCDRLVLADNVSDFDEGVLGGFGAERPNVCTFRPEHPRAVVRLKFGRHAKSIHFGGAKDVECHRRERNVKIIVNLQSRNQELAIWKLALARSIGCHASGRIEMLGKWKGHTASVGMD
jgi:hypothetical protein